MTQSKKKKRVNRSLLLAKKIIIKDGGTVSSQIIQNKLRLFSHNTRILRKLISVFVE